MDARLYTILVKGCVYKYASITSGIHDVIARHNGGHHYILLAGFSIFMPAKGALEENVLQDNMQKDLLGGR